MASFAHRSAPAARPPGSCPLPSSIDAVVRQYERLVAAAVRRVVGHRGDVDDLVQETWIVYMRFGRQVHDQAALGGWLFKVATRLATRHHQRSARCESLPRVDDVVEPDAPHDPVDGLMWQERRLALAREYLALNSRERMVVELLVDGNDLAYREISERLGMPVGSIGPTRERVIHKLRSMPSLARLADDGSCVVADRARRAS